MKKASANTIYLQLLDHQEKLRQARIIPKQKYKMQSDAIALRKIIKTVSRHFGYSIKQIRTSTPNHLISKVRFIIYYIAKDIYNISSSRIAKFLGRSDHSAISKGRNKLLEMLSSNQTIALDLHSIRFKLNADNP